jgi:hypothetical protein
MTLRPSRRPHYHGLNNVEHYGVVYDILTAAGDLVGRVHHNGDGWQLRWSITCPYCGAELGDRHLGVTRPNMRRPRKGGASRVHADIEARLLKSIRADLANSDHMLSSTHPAPGERISAYLDPATFGGYALFARVADLGGSARDRRRTLRASQRAARRILAAITTP